MKSLYKLPRSVLATLLIGIGIFFIVLNDPPHHICDTQIEHFKSKQSKIEDWEKLIEVCRETNSPGGCYEMFAHLRITLKHFYLVSKECIEPLSRLSEVKKKLLEGMEWMARLAWREEVLSGTVDKFNWIGPADMTLFCNIKDRVIVIYGRQTFLDFEKKLLTKLSESADPKIVRKKSILSEYCANYR